MNISSLCRREVVSVNANASVREAAQAMRSEHVGALAVTDPEEPGRIVGILTDRDLVVDVLATGRPPAGLAVGNLCHGELVGVPAASSVDDAVNAMQRAGVRRLVVQQADGSVVGLVSADDLFEAIATELGGLAGALRGGIVREGMRVRSGAEARQQPRSLYLSRNEP
jgi:CBS domain-containing protein